MEKKVSSTGMYETTYSGDVFVGKLYTPTKIGLTDQTKVALLEYLTESDEFHKLVCDITGTERKQVKVSPELEKLKEDYSHVCNRYKQEQQKSNDLLHKYREETAKRLDAEKESESVAKHHKFIIDKISEILREVDCSSVKNMADQLKAERANGKLLAEDNELCRRDNDRLKQSYDNVCEEKYELRRELEKVKKERDSIQSLYNHDFKHLNGCNKNQAEMITDQVKEIELLKKDYQYQSDLAQKYREKSEKLQVKLDKASKRYGELIKTINDRAIK